LHVISYKTLKLTWRNGALRRTLQLGVEPKFGSQPPLQSQGASAKEGNTIANKAPPQNVLLQVHWHNLLRVRVM
jgi:hypothetical protein